MPKRKISQKGAKGGGIIGTTLGVIGGVAAGATLLSGAAVVGGLTFGYNKIKQLGKHVGKQLGKGKREKRGGAVSKRTKKVLGIVGGIAAGAAAIGGAAYGYNVIGQHDNLSPVQQMAQISSAFHKFDVKPGGFAHGLMTRFRGS